MARLAGGVANEKHTPPLPVGPVVRREHRRRGGLLARLIVARGLLNGRGVEVGTVRSRGGDPALSALSPRGGGALCSPGDVRPALAQGLPAPRARLCRRRRRGLLRERRPGPERQPSPPSALGQLLPLDSAVRLAGGGEGPAARNELDALVRIVEIGADLRSGKLCHMREADGSRAE